MGSNFCGFRGSLVIHEKSNPLNKMTKCAWSNTGLFHLQKLQHWHSGKLDPTKFSSYTVRIIHVYNCTSCISLTWATLKCEVIADRIMTRPSGTYNVHTCVHVCCNTCEYEQTEYHAYTCTSIPTYLHSLLLCPAFSCPAEGWREWPQGQHATYM